MGLNAKSQVARDLQALGLIIIYGLIDSHTFVSQADYFKQIPKQHDHKKGN